MREIRRGDARERVLEAARSLFTEHGTDGVTMAEVASAAGVARATVFNHFGSKHALVEAITEQVLSRYEELLADAIADRGTPAPDQLRALFSYMGRGIEEDRRFFRAVFREIAKLSVGLDEGGPGQRARQAALDELVQLVTRGQARGELSRAHRPEDLAGAFDGLLFGVITHWLYDDASEPLHLRMERAAEVLLSPVEEAGAAREPARRSRRSA